MYGVLTYHSACVYEMLEELRVTALKPTTLHGHGHAEQMHANLPGGDFPMGGPCFHVSTLDSRDAVFEEPQSLKASKPQKPPSFVLPLEFLEEYALLSLIANTTL